MEDDMSKYDRIVEEINELADLIATNEQTIEDIKKRTDDIYITIGGGGSQNDIHLEDEGFNRFISEALESYCAFLVAKNRIHEVALNKLLLGG
jgi:hypothetical protein